MYCCQCRQRVTVLPHLISHCNSCLQALVPGQTSKLACHLSSSSGQLADLPAACSPPDDTPHAQAASEKSVGRVATPLADMAEMASDSAQADTSTGSGEPKAEGADADVPLEVGEAAVLDRMGLEGPMLDGPVGQPLIEATIEMLLAVLRNSEDPGQLSMTGLLCGLPNLLWHTMRFRLELSSSLTAERAKIP